jgi:hypothetical protein
MKRLYCICNSSCWLQAVSNLQISAIHSCWEPNCVGGVALYLWTFANSVCSSVFGWIDELITSHFLKLWNLLSSSMNKLYYALSLSTVHSYSVCNSSLLLVTTKQPAYKSQLYLAVGNLILWMFFSGWLSNLLAVIFWKPWNLLSSSMILRFKDRLCLCTCIVNWTFLFSC